MKSIFQVHVFINSSVLLFAFSHKQYWFQHIFLNENTWLTRLQSFLVFDLPPVCEATFIFLFDLRLLSSGVGHFSLQISCLSRSFLYLTVVSNFLPPLFFPPFVCSRFSSLSFLCLFFLLCSSPVMLGGITVGQAQAEVI